jgi:uncharacterized protein
MVMVFAAVAVLIGAVVRGYAGFGASMFWVASLALVYPPSTVVPTVLALEVVASLVLLRGNTSHVEWGSMSWMLAATAVTTPFGVLLLAVVPEDPMRVVVAIAILLGTLATASGVDLSRGSGRGSAITAGAVSGVVNGSTGTGGPPAVLLYFSPSRSVEVGRATLIVYFLGTDAVGLVIMWIGGLVDREVFRHAALFTPLALVGILAGQWLFRRHGDRGFRRVVVALLLALSVTMLVRALSG